MKWIADLMRKCLPLKVEVVRVSNRELSELPLPTEQVVNGLAPAHGIGMSQTSLLFVCATIPPSRIANELLHMVPADVQCLFVESLKKSTAMELSMMMAQAGVLPMITTEGHHLKLNVQGPNVPELHDEIWNRMQTLLMKDGFARSWEISINDEKIVYDAKMIKETEEHHQLRDTSIGQDDQTDLHIMLEATQSVDQFLALLEGKPFEEPKRRKRGADPA